MKCINVFNTRSTLPQVLLSSPSIFLYLPYQFIANKTKQLIHRLIFIILLDTQRIFTIIFKVYQKVELYFSFSRNMIFMINKSCW